MEKNREPPPPQIDFYKYSQLIFDKEAKAIQWSKNKNRLFNKLCWKNWIST